MNNELDHLLSQYATVRKDYPNHIIYLLVEYYTSGIELSMHATTDAQRPLSANGCTRHIVNSEDDLIALVSMLEL